MFVVPVILHSAGQCSFQWHRDPPQVQCGMMYFITRVLILIHVAFLPTVPYYADSNANHYCAVPSSECLLLLLLTNYLCCWVYTLLCNFSIHKRLTWSFKHAGQTILWIWIVFYLPRLLRTYAVFIIPSAAFLFELVRALIILCCGCLVASSVLILDFWNSAVMLL